MHSETPRPTLRPRGVSAFGRAMARARGALTPRVAAGGELHPPTRHAFPSPDNGRGEHLGASRFTSSPSKLLSVAVDPSQLIRFRCRHSEGLAATPTQPPSFSSPPSPVIGRGGPG